MVAGQPVNIQALDSDFLASTETVLVKDGVYVASSQFFLIICQFYFID
jgi:hypothetical protein